MRLRNAFAALLLAGTNWPSHAAPLGPDQLNAMDRLVAEAISARSLPGAALAITVDGKVVANRTFGVSDLGTNSPVTEATLFRLGSISKFVTAAAVLHLVQQGRFRLSDQVSTILKGRPDLSRHLRGVTVRELLNHTSGLADLTPEELGEIVTKNSPVSDDHVVAALRRPARARPGMTWSYNNSGFRLLSWVVEDSTGRPFNDYVIGELAPALNLKSLQPCDLVQSGLARGYIAADGKFVADPSYSVRGLLGDGGLCANVVDLALLPSRLIEKKWINARTLAGMTQPTSLQDGTLVDYGLGVRRGIVGSQTMWGHTGSGLAGGWAAVAHYPERKMTIAVVGNGGGGSDDAITLQAKIAATLLSQHELRDAKVESHFQESLPMVLEADGTRVCFNWATTGVTRRLAGSSTAPRPLLHQGNGVFARSDYPLDRYVFQVARGRTVAHRVYYDGFFAELLRPAKSTTC